MMVSTKGRYALRFLVALSKREDGKYSSLYDIAKEEEISPKYLEKIAKLLLSNDIIESARGKEGGYRLKKEASDIFVSDVLKVTEESLAPVECLCSEANSCKRQQECPTLPMWKALYDSNMDYFSSISIASLGKREF